MQDAAITLFGEAAPLIFVEKMTQKSDNAKYTHGGTLNLVYFRGDQSFCSSSKLCTSVFTDEVSRPVTGFVIPEVVTSLFGGLILKSQIICTS